MTVPCATRRTTAAPIASPSDFSKKPNAATTTMTVGSSRAAPKSRERHDFGSPAFSDTVDPAKFTQSGYF